MNPLISVRGGVPEVDINEMLNDELVGLNNTVDREMGAGTSKKERWAARHLEKAVQLRIVSETLRGNVQRMEKSPRRGSSEGNMLPERKDRTPLCRSNVCTREQKGECQDFRGRWSQCHPGYTSPISYMPRWPLAGSQGHDAVAAEHRLQRRELSSRGISDVKQI